MKSNIKIETLNYELRPPKSPEGGLQDSTSLVECC
jgi:hypothetical protein